MPPQLSVDQIIGAMHDGEWTTAELVRLSHAVASFGKNLTSILGQYGEGLVADAFGGQIGSFDQKAFDVRTPHDGDLQVKTYSRGKRPGTIRSFTHDVITVEVDPATAEVVSAGRYTKDDLHRAFAELYSSKYRDLGLVWSGSQADRFERGWSITRGVPYTDITHLFRRA